MMIPMKQTSTSASVGGNPSSLSSCKDSTTREKSTRSSQAPAPITTLPATVTGMLDCIRHEIQLLNSPQNCANNATGSCTHSSASLEDALDDGFLCIDVQVLRTKLQKFQELFLGKVTPYFAVKCHSDPMVVRVLTEQNTPHTSPHCGLDCASMYELQLAHALQNFESTPIVYANPQRAEAELQHALQLWSSSSASSTQRPFWLTVDGMEELYKIQKAMEQHHEQANNKAVKVELVVRILVPDGHSQVPLGEKFGISLEAIPPLVKSAGELHLPIIGVSFHCGSGCHDPQTYQQALALAKQAMQMIDEEIHNQATTAATTKIESRQDNTHNITTAQPSLPGKCWLLDIGGGFPGWDGVGGDEGRFSGVVAKDTPTLSTTTSEQETTAEIAYAIRDQLQDFCNRGITIIAEPGRYFVEASACLASRIYKKDLVVARNDANVQEEKTIREYKIAHGVHGVFKDALLCGESFVPMAQRDPTAENDNGNASNDEMLYPSLVRGPTGDTKNGQDVVCESCELPDLQVGDWLVFDRMGAYTISIASRTGQPIVRYVQGATTC